MRFKNKTLDLLEPRVMGILNVTPDSFSDGGEFVSRQAALEQARKMVAEGAAMVDVGGESTRPGAKQVTESEELDRVIPVIESISNELDVIISVDTSKAGVMCEAVKAGADFINDVHALRGEGALTAAAELQVPVCLMHMQGEPGTMQASPDYENVVDEVKLFLAHRIESCLKAGLQKDQIIVDPGFGFGKKLEHNLELLSSLKEFSGLGVPVLVGLSRKSMLGAMLDQDVDGRLHGSTALAGLAVWLGAGIIRAHDVGPTVQTVRSISAVKDLSREN